MRFLRSVAALAVIGITALSGERALADPVPRQAPAAGSVIAVKMGEEINFVETANWRGVENRQDVLPGDVLRTNNLGQLALLFADRTQIRLGRNSTLLVKEIGGDNARFGLQSGAIWARAARGGTSVTIDTPAAAAAVRGTDWSLRVAPDGLTSLIVFEGQVELFNPQGSVLVNEGEAASARIGEKPTKIVIVDVDERAQQLYYFSIKDSFTYLVPTVMPTRLIIPEHRRLHELPPEQRSAEDWVSVAELSFSIEPVAVTEAISLEARSRSLTVAQTARLDALDGLIASFHGHYARAVELYGSAIPHLDSSRRSVARYGQYFARALADPSFDQPPPVDGDSGPYGLLAEAFFEGFVNGPNVAAKKIKEAEARWPDEALLPAVRAQFALISNDDAQMAEAVERAISLDPDNPVALLARAYYRLAVKSDFDGAIADLHRASELQPGQSEIWNMLGIAYDERGATVESEKAFLRSLDVDPRNPIARSNLGLLYLNSGDLKASKEQADAAVELDPELSIALLIRGRYRAAVGDLDGALEDFLKASTIDPGYSQATALVAVAYFQLGEDELAAQALENAARLDPEDPLFPLVAANIALDAYRADDALIAARDSFRLSRAQGGNYARFAASRDSGTTLNETHRFLGLDAWGRYYGDLTFDPFSGGSYFDRAIASAPNPFLNSSDYTTFGTDPMITDRGLSALVQGLLLEPSGASAPIMRRQLMQVPFFETAAGGTVIAGNEDGFGGNLEIQSRSVTPFPLNFSLTGEWVEAKSDSDAAERRIKNAAVVMGGQVSIQDRFIGIGVISDGSDPQRGDRTDSSPLDPFDEFIGYGIAGWSHTFAERNVLNVALTAGRVQTDFQTNTFVANVPYDFEQHVNRDIVIGSVGHSIGEGSLTLRYGADAGWLSGDDKTRINVPNGPPGLETTVDVDVNVFRGYADLRWEANEDVTLEAALFATDLSGDVDNAGFDLGPRLGAAWSFYEGQWLRAAVSRDVRMPGLVSLAPTDVIGLEPMVIPLDFGGEVDTLAVRWDAEWSAHLFTALEYQHQKISNASLDVPTSFLTEDVPEGSIDRVQFTANAWLGHGVGLFGTVAWADSEASGEGVAPGASVPFIPDWYGRAGLTFVLPQRVTGTVSTTYVGDREGSVDGTMLGDFVTLDAQLSWESPDRHVKADLSAYNILDADFELAPGIAGWGRTFVGSLGLRF